MINKAEKIVSGIKAFMTSNNSIIILLLVLLNLVLKGIYLGEHNLDLDEPFTLYQAQGGLGDLVNIMKWDNNPPLFYMLLHYWIRIFGISPFATRSLSLLFSSFTVIFIYKIGVKFINHFVAFSSSILFTFSNFIILMAHYARAYSLMIFLSVVSMYYFLSLIKSPRRYYLIALTIVNSLLIYSHFMGFFIILIQSLSVLVIKEVRVKILKFYFISSLITAMLYTPYIYFFILRFLDAAGNGLYGRITTPIALLIAFKTTCSNDFTSAQLFILILLSFLLILLFSKIKLNSYEKILAGWFLSIFLIYLISIKISLITVPRYIVFLTPGFFILLSIAIYHHQMLSKYFPILLFVVCALMMIKSTNLRIAYPFEAGNAVSIVKQNKSNSTLVLIYPFYVDVIVAYNYNTDIFRDYGNLKQRLNENKFYTISSVSDIENISSFSYAKNIILIDAWNKLSFEDPGGEIINRIRSDFKTINIIGYVPGYKIYQFKSKTVNDI